MCTSRETNAVVEFFMGKKIASFKEALTFTSSVWNSDTFKISIGKEMLDWPLRGEVRELQSKGL